MLAGMALMLQTWDVKERLPRWISGVVWVNTSRGVRHRHADRVKK